MVFNHCAVFESLSTMTCVYCRPALNSIIIYQMKQTVILNCTISLAHLCVIFLYLYPKIGLFPTIHLWLTAHNISYVNRIWKINKLLVLIISGLCYITNHYCRESFIIHKNLCNALLYCLVLLNIDMKTKNQEWAADMKVSF